MRRRWFVGPVVLALTVSACGSEGSAPLDANGVAVTIPAPAEGPAPDLEVAPASVDSPLPDVVVRQINQDGGWVQFKNLLPSDRPLLVWFWAPH
jgi:hypothetical protein